MSDQDRDPFAELRGGWADPPDETKPRTRWWWFGPDVERGELERELDAMAAAGFGGAEVAFVYPLSADPDTFVSKPLLDDLRFAAEAARARGLSLDITVGSGWSFGGPHIEPEHAARRLHWDERLIGAGPAGEVRIPPAWPGDELIGVYLSEGADLEANPVYEPLPVTSDNTAVFPQATGPRRVLLATSRLTGQQVKRAAKGAEGPVLDHYSAAAARAHIAAVAEPIVEAVGPELIGSVFCDSLEVYASDWTPALVEEFAARRGYDPLPRLYLLAVEGAGFEQLRADYYRTLTELYEDNFVAVMGDWARGRGVPFRIQSYGEPPGTVSSYRHADAFEGEGWGWRGLPQTRWASAAAHIYGKDVVSSEVWTWTHSPSLRATPLDLKGEAHDHFLNGINQLYSHGWPYSPPDAPGLGWIFYAAGAIDDRNPWWAAMPGLSRYLQRLSWILRQGTPVADVAVYVPAREAYAAMGTWPVAAPHGGDLWRRTRQLLGDIPASIRGAGYDFDCVDDDALAVLPADRYRLVVLPGVRSLPDPVTRWLRSARAAGAAVFGVDDPADVDAHRGAVDADRWVGHADLAAALAHTLRADVRVDPPADDVGIAHRRIGTVDAYLVANTGPAAVSTRLHPRATPAGYEVWRPEDGSVLAAGPGAGGIPIDLAPYQAVLVLTSPSPSSTPARESLPDRQTGRTPLATWTLVDSVRTVTAPHVWQEDQLVEPDRLTLRYRTSVELRDLTEGQHVRLDFGEPQPDEPGDLDITALRPHSYRARLRPPLGEVAEVRVNGSPAGVVWAPPYQLDITPWLHAGVNELELEVATVGSRALAHDPHITEAVERSRRLYGARFTMQDLHLADVDLRSGLLAVPALVTLSSS